MGKWQPNRRLVRAALERARAARPPMSAILGELIEHITERAAVPETESGYQAWLELCTMAWNASRLALQGDRMRDLVDEAQREACESDPNVAAVYKWIIRIAGQKYPADRRIVTRASLTLRDEEVIVHATTSELA